MVYKTLQVAFLNADFDELGFPIGDLGCTTQLRSDRGDSEYYDVVLLSNQQYRAHVPITNQSAQVQFIVKRMINDKFIGSVSINVADFIQQKSPEWQQWLTLFDEINDDAFDGDLQIDDTEQPRVLFGFKLLTQEFRSPSPAKSPEIQKMSVSSESYAFSASLSQETPSVNQFVTGGNSKNKKSTNAKEKEHYSPRFDPPIQMTNASCQVDLMSQELQTSFKLRLEIERLNDFQRKYELSKKALHRLQDEYTEMFNMYNQQMEEKDHELKQMAQENYNLRGQMEQLQQKVKILHSEIDALKRTPQLDDSKHYHTFQQPMAAPNKSKVIIDDMTMQNNNLRQQLNSQEQKYQYLETRYSELQDQFNSVINQTFQQKIDFVKQLQEAQDAINKNDRIITSQNERIKKLSNQYDQTSGENKFLENEVKRLVSECEWNQKTIFKLNHQIEELKLRHLEETRQLQDELSQTSTEMNDVYAEKAQMNQTLLIKQTQLDSYINVVGNLENYVNLLTRYQDSEQKKSSLQIKLTEMSGKSNDELANWGLSLQKRAQQLKDDYENQLKSQQNSYETVKNQCQEYSNQVKQLQVEIVRMSLLITRLKDENDLLQQQQSQMRGVEKHSDHVQMQMIRLTNDLISKHQESYMKPEKNKDLPRPMKY